MYVILHFNFTSCVVELFKVVEMILSVRGTPDMSANMSMTSSYHLIMLQVSYTVVARVAGNGVYRYIISKYDNC